MSWEKNINVRKSREAKLGENGKVCGCPEHSSPASLSERDSNPTFFWLAVTTPLVSQAHILLVVDIFQ